MKKICILDIDYDNVVVQKHFVKDRVVFTVDNFYKYPNSILGHYRKNQDKSIKSRVSYPGNVLEMKEVLSTDEVDRHIEDLRSLLCAHGFPNDRLARTKSDHMSLCKYVDETRQTGKLRGNHIKDRGTVSNPHTDASPTISNYNTLACLCYLSKDIHGGTGLYYNKQLHTFCTNWNFENEDRWNLWKKVQAVTTDNEKLLIIRNHYTDRGNKLYPNLRTKGFMNKSEEHFDLLHLFPMKYNRLIVYDGDIMHAMYVEDENFFKVHERITSNYFLDTCWDETVTDKSKILPASESLKLADMIDFVAQYL